MLLKYFAIFAVCFALLAFGFSRWKKKYGHTNRPFKAGDKRPQTANFDIGRAVEWERGRGKTVDGTKVTTKWKITLSDLASEDIDALLKHIAQ